MSKPTHILIVEDQKADFDLARHELSKAVEGCVFKQVESRQGFLDSLVSFQPDVILSDYSLPSFDGMSALKLAKQHAPLTPFIIWTGSMSEDVAVECMKAGANNYILKENIKRLGPAVIHAVDERQLILERIQAEQNLRESEKRFRSLIENSLDNISLLAADGTLLWENPAVNRTLGYEQDAFVKRSIFELMHPDDMNWTKNVFAQMVGEAGSQRRGIFRLRHQNGTWRWIEATATNMLNVSSVRAVVINYRDITERRQAEIEIQQRTDDLQVINAINEAVIRGESMDGIVTLLAGELKRIFSTNGSTMYMLSPDGRLLTMQQYMLPPELTRKIERVIGSTIPLVQIPVQEGGFFHRVLTSPRGVITSDPEQIMKWMEEFTETSFLPSVARGAVRKLIPQIFKLLNIRSTITVPLVLEGKTIGLLDVSSANLFTEKELQRIENISGHLTTAIQRQQSIEQVGRSQAFLQSIQDALSASIAILNESGEIIQVNSAWRKFGEQNGLLHPEYCIGLNYLEICDSVVGPDADQAQLTAKGIREVITGEKREVEIEYPCHSPEEKRWFSLRITKFDDGEHVWVVLAHENISRRKLAEESLRETSEQFRTLFEASPDAILLIEPRGNWPIVDCNTAACQMNGYTREELIGQSISILNLSPGKAIERSEYLEKIRASDILRYEDRHRRKDGKVFPIEVSTSLITIGGREMVLGIDRDITERKQAEDKLRESEERFRTLVNSMNDVVYTLDRQQRHTGVYGPWVEASGLSAEDFIGKTAREIMGKEAAQVHEEANIRALTGQTIAYEWAAPGPNGMQSYQTALSPLRDATGEIVGLVGVGRDITESKRAEQALRESEEKYRLLFESNPLPMWIYDLETLRFLKVNEAAVNHYGYSKDEFMAMTIKDIRPASDIPRLLENISRVDQGIDKAGVWSHIKRDGSLMHVEIISHVVQFNDRQAELVLANDVTERIQAQTQIGELLTFNEKLLNNSPVGILAYKHTGQCIFANQTAASIVGSEIGHLRAQNYHTLESWKKSRLYELAEKAMQGEEAQISDIHLLSTFGRDSWLTAHCVKFRLNEEDHLLLLLSDITERKLAESAEHEQRTLAEALRDTAETLNSTLDYGEVLDHILNAVGKVVPHDAASILLIEQGIARVVRLQGYAERGLDTDITKLEFPLMDTINLNQMYESRQPVVISDTHTFPGWQKVPATAWLRSNVGTPITISGEVVGFILLDSETTGFFTEVHAERLKAFASQAAIAIQNARLLQQAQDEIAERKQAEKALRESEEKYRLLFDANPLPMWIYDAETLQFLKVNEAAINHYGYSEAEFRAMTIKDIRSPADVSRLLETISHHRDGIDKVGTWSHIKKDGSLIQVEIISHEVDFEGHRAELILANDVTERIRTEKELHEEQEKARKYLEIAGVMMLALDRDGNVSLINQKGCEILGYPDEEIVGKNWIDTFIPESMRNEMQKIFQQLINNNAEVSTYYENPVLTRDGEERMIAWHNTLVMDENGRIITSLSSGEDITERKQAEEELRASEERFRQLADNIQEVFWMTDAITDEELYISPASERVWERPVDEMLHGQNTFIESILPEDRPHVVDMLKAQRNGQQTDMEYRIMRPDGSVRWVWDRAFPIFDDTGKLVRLAGIAADITERKQAQEKLRESENRYRGLFENLVIGFALHEIITDQEGKPVDYIFLEINPMFEKLTGIRARDAIGRRVSEILPEVENERFIPLYGNVALSGKPVHLEEFSKDLNKYYEINAYSPKRGQFAVTFIDITERKQAEEQLRKLSRAVEQSASTIIITDPAGSIEYANPKFTETTGYTFEEAVGQNPSILKSDFTTSEEYQQLWNTITAGEEWRGEFLNKKKDGEQYWESATISPIFNERREITHFIAVKENITERKRAEEETSRHLAEMQALYENGLAVGQLLNPREIGARIIETFARHLSWHHAAIRLLQPGTDILDLIAFNQPGLSEAERYDIEHHFQSMISQVGKGLSGWVVQTGTPLCTGNVHAHPQYIDTHIGIQSGLYMPLKIGDHIIGVVSVESEEPNAFTPQDERLLATLANQAAIAFENARLYQTNQQERERFSDLFENSPVATWLEDFSAVISWMDGLRVQGVTDLAVYLASHPEQYKLGVSLIQILDVNHAAVLMNGARNKSELIEKVHGLMTEETPSQIMIDELNLIWKGYTSFGFEMSSRKLDDSLITGIQRVYIPSNNNVPDYTRVIVTSTDITERKLSESLMDKRLELMEYSSEHSLEELMQKAINDVSKWTRSTVGFFQLIKEDETTPTVQVWSTDKFQHFHSSRMEEMHKPADQAGVWAEAVHQRRAVIHNDFESLIGKKGLPEGHTLLIRELVLPIIRNEKIVAVIGIGNKAQDYTQGDLEITERFADYAWDIIERKRMVIEIAEERNLLAKRVEERTSDLSRANSNLARALRVKDEFLANMSHELRTPLNAILGLSESLSEQTAGSLNEKQQKYLNTISESGHHLLSLINDILDLAKIEAGQITLDINKVDVNSVSQASLRMIKQLAQKKNLEVSVEIDDKLGLMWADERRLKQMIVNLLSNAVKFTPEDGRLGLKVSGDQEENKVSFTVWDTGIGIKQEDFERLFQPFVQLDSGLARESSGTGLGLALVSQMARLHGGSVSVESEAGTGSRFTITLPWEPHLAPDMVERMKVTGKFRTIRPGDVQQTILLVEDTQEVVMMIKDYLEIAGYKVATAQDGLDGITQAKFTHPDLILMDVQMPRMDGLEATKKLREDPEFKYTPIIALTALAMPNDRERCIAAGMDEYISKPVNLRGLVKLVQNYLSMREERTKPR